MKRNLIILILALLGIAANAQSKKDGGYMEYFVEGKDTVYYDLLRASRVIERMPRMKGKDWRKYYRLVYNFNKAYPYALAAKKVIAIADSTILTDKLKKNKREKYLKGVQDELFKEFEKPMRKLSINQGVLIMKLIDRECGKSSFSLIRDYRNGIAASFWQGIAKLFGSDLKRPYDPLGDDYLVEDLVDKWNKGEFEDLYFSLFWKYPPKTEIPSKYM